MKQRFYSLDVFRGATVALMILVNNPGTWAHTYDPLKHAAWHGCTPTDLVFPFFLFAVGNAMAFVMPGLETAGAGSFWKKLLKRTVLIFGIGLLLNWFPFVKYDDAGKLVPKSLESLRIMGVLQRIALCYFFAGLIVYYLKIRGAFVFAAFLLLAYWFLCIATNPADPYSIHGWFGTAIDKRLLGPAHLYKGEGIPFDPEGLPSTIAAIVQVIFGYIAGHYIITKGKTAEMVNGLFVAGCVMVFAGFCWDTVFPLNKKIWTSSYTVYTSGLALLILALLIYLIEFKQQRGGWTQFFDVFGKNPLFIFVLSGALPRLLALIRISNGSDGDGKPKFLSPFGWFYEQVCNPLFNDPKNSSLLYAICFIVLMWFIAWILHKRKIYIRV
ncbi:MAG: heparan-alpha-glucosaminide N-acetyltransferase domain-containing protein [Ferruginibacter sp.]